MQTATAQSSIKTSYISLEREKIIGKIKLVINSDNPAGYKILASSQNNGYVKTKDSDKQFKKISYKIFCLDYLENKKLPSKSKNILFQHGSKRRVTLSEKPTVIYENKNPKTNTVNAKSQCKIVLNKRQKEHLNYKKIAGEYIDDINFTIVEFEN